MHYFFFILLVLMHIYYKGYFPPHKHAVCVLLHLIHSHYLAYYHKICKISVVLRNIYLIFAGISTMVEQVKYNGDCSCSQPYMHKFHSGVPIFLKTPQQWMKQVTWIKWFSYYKWLVTLLRSVFAENDEIYQNIVHKLNRDMVSFNNMQQLIPTYLDDLL